MKVERCVVLTQIFHHFMLESKLTWLSIAYSASIHALHSEINNSNNHNMIKNPNWEEATSWLFTSVAKDLNSGRPRTNPAKWPEQNSNPGPPDCQLDVLTTWPSCLLSQPYLLICIGSVRRKLMMITL